MISAKHLRIAVAGAGSFGRNHIRVYRELQAAGASVELAAIIDPDHSLAHAAADGSGIPVFSSADECAEAVRNGSLQLDAASVAVPTVHHAAVATALLEAGLDVLVEKPIAARLADADALVETASRLGRILQVGHLERFNPAVTAVIPHLRGPMFFEAHRLSIFTPRALDVDVVLDLMIHDLDIVLAFAASPVREVRAVGLPILSGKVDIANVRVEFESGCVANFTASRVSTERVRKLRFFQPHQYVSLDYARQDVLFIDVSAVAANPSYLAQAATAASHPSAGLGLHKLPVTSGEPLRLEIESFLNAVRTRSRPVVSGEDGRAALALAIEIHQATAKHHARAGLDRYVFPAT